MLQNHVDGLTLAYGFFNMLRLVSYVPQIVLVARDRTGAAAIAISSWLIWTGANATTALYAWEKLADAPLTLLNVFNTACCALVLALVVLKRARARPRASAKDMASLRQASSSLMMRAG